MKKNLRIASAAAAALLAVAPVAASAVNTANADVSFDNNQTSAPSVSATKVAVNVNLGSLAGKTVSQIVSQAKVTATMGGASHTVADGYQVKIQKVDDKGTFSAITDPDHTKLTAGEYKVTVSDLKINGLINNTKYTATEGKFTGDNTTNGEATGTQIGNGVSFEENFHVDHAQDKNAIGTPFFKTAIAIGSGATAVPAETAVSSGALNVSYSDVNSVTDLANKLENSYVLAVAGAGTGKNAAVPNTVQYKQAVRSSLAAAGITVKADGTFDKPANTFMVNLTGSLNNGKSTTLPVLVTFTGTQTADRNDAPQITANANVTGAATSSYTAAENNITLASSAPAWANVSLNGHVDTNAIKNSFSAKISSPDDTNLPLSVDASKVNTAVAGSYPVTVSATNPQGKTTKVTFNITVGDPNAKYEVAKQDGDVYNINGNNVTKSNTSVKTGDNIATYGTVTVDGKQYVRINKADANQFVEASVFTAPAKEESTSTTIMYKSAVYKNNDGKLAKAGKTIKGYHDADLVVDAKGNLKKYTIEGQSFYKLANENGYVRERNVTGSKMTLKKNAYVYKSNGRRANRKLLKKGSTITVYGDKYKAIRHYRKEAVRIGHNKYVKLPNVKYSKDLLVK